jgi:hypothetical protein
MTITKKIAAETDKARRHKVATTIRVRGAKSTKAAENESEPENQYH